MLPLKDIKPNLEVAAHVKHLVHSPDEVKRCRVFAIEGCYVVVEVPEWDYEFRRVHFMKVAALWTVYTEEETEE